MELFDDSSYKAREPVPPLADRMRPRTFDELFGQDHLVGPDAPLRAMVESDSLFSFILWGPPGSGKTAIAHIIENQAQVHFVAFSAVLSGVKEIRQVIASARTLFAKGGRRTLLFVDEIHRFNKAQQDAFLPHVEKGTIFLIGATTENPSFEVNSALLSRVRVFTLKPLTEEHLVSILNRALSDEERGLGRSALQLEGEALARLCRTAQGDARQALNALEIAASLLPRPAGRKMEGEKTITAEMIERALQHSSPIYDKGGEEHYNLISAYIKSLRGSDPDAALYWLARMIEGGEDPLFLTRRMVVFASEDVGNADPTALQVAVAAKEAVQFIGMPEGMLPLAQATTYLATAPKSNASYMAYLSAKKDAVESGSLLVPLHLRNAPTGLMKSLGYGKDYKYPHDHADGFVPEDYFPEGLAGRIYYTPGGKGYEKVILDRLRHWREIRGKVGR